MVADHPSLVCFIPMTTSASWQALQTFWKTSFPGPFGRDCAEAIGMRSPAPRQATIKCFIRTGYQTRDNGPGAHPVMRPLCYLPDIEEGLLCATFEIQGSRLRLCC